MSQYPLNAVSAAIGKINFSGNVIPHSWFKNIINKNGKPNSIAIMLLSEIIYWYRPTEYRDPKTYETKYFRKYKADILQKSYADLENALGFTKDQLRDAFECLEKHELAFRELRTIEVNGQRMS